MKNIFLQRIPYNENGTSIFSLDIISKIHKIVKDELPEDCILITSPLDLTKVDGNIKIINIDCKEYSTNELLDIIEKASMYDGLCK